MKTISIIIGIIIFILLLSFIGCPKGCQKQIKHYKSSIIGLNRVVTVYDYKGQQIKRWQGKFQVEKEGNGAILSFIENGKERKVVGGIIIIEEL